MGADTRAVEFSASYRGMISRLLAAVGVRQAEADRFLYCYAVFFLSFMGLTIGLSVSESLFLSHVGIKALPLQLILSSVAVIAGSAVYGAIAGRVSLERIFLVLLGGVLTLVLALAPALYGGSRPAFWALSIAVTMFEQILFLQTFSFAFAHFTALESKRLFAPISTGATVGSLAGGAAVGVWTEFRPALDMVFVWCGVNVLCGALIVWGSRRVRRMGGGGAEDDEAGFLESLRDGLGYMRVSRLGRRLAVGGFAMAFASSLATFQYSNIFVRRYASADDLAGFIGWVLSGINLLEIAVGLYLTPWLLASWGVARTALIYPASTLLSFAGMLFAYAVPAGVAARFSRDTVESVVSDPSVGMVYDGVPARLRPSLRAFIEGSISSAGGWAAGLFLLAAQSSWSPEALSLAGLASSALLLWAYAGFLREYPSSLMDRLREGTLDPEAATRGFAGNLPGLSDAVRSLCRSGDERAVVLLSDFAVKRRLEVLAPVLAAELPGLATRPALAVLSALESLGQPGSAKAVLEAARSPTLDLRAAALGCLRRLAPEEALRLSRERFGGAGADLEGIEAAACLAGRGDPREREEAQRALADASREPDPALRSALARSLARDGLLERSPLALGLLGDGEPDVRLEATRCLPERPSRPELGERLRELALEGTQPAAVRVEAVRRLDPGGPTFETDLLRLFGDRGRRVRDAAVALGGGLGAGSAPLLKRACQEDGSGGESASRALALAAPGPETEAFLKARLIETLRRTHEAVLSAAALPGEDGAACRAALEDYRKRSVERVLSVLSTLDPSGRCETAVRWLRGGDEQARASALELLTNLWERRLSELLVPLIESLTGPELLETSRRLLGRPDGGPRDPREELRRHGDAWVRLAGMSLEGDGGIKMKELLLLKKVSLFGGMTLDQLEAIREICVEHTYLKGQVVFEEGAVGGHLYLLLSGKVDILKGSGGPSSTRLAELGEGGYFGELSILDSQERSATAVVVENARVLTLEKSRFEQLALDIPEMALEICRGLSRHLRQTDERLAAARFGGTGKRDRLDD